MTFAEVVLSGRAWQFNQELEWDRARSVIADVRNAGLIARGGSVKNHQLFTPTRVRNLSMLDPAKEVTTEDLKAPKKLWDVAKKLGVIKKKRRPLSEIFKKPQ